MKDSPKMKATSDRGAVPIRCVHLDLKGVPPTDARLVRLLEIFAAAGYNAVLAEWEDTFPWTVDERFRSETAYSPETIRKFVSAAGRLGIEIIPLVQCLGHMETPLRLPEYAPMRELPHDEAVLNPLAPGARALVEKMVADVLRLMPRVRYFHLGGDEAWTFGSHPDTKKFIARHGKGALYLKHVEPILDMLNRRGIRPLLWHDMMREWDSAALKRLARKADLVVWGYRGHPDTTTGHWNKSVIERFVAHKVALWGAGAYKGADGFDKDLPDPAARADNMRAWMEVSARYGFRGIIATAWSRYSTNICQNEPIDGALDSLFNVGKLLRFGRLPEGGIEDCWRDLDRIGEGRRFRAVHDALLKLGRARDTGWSQVRNLREVTMTVTQDARRRPSWAMVKWLRQMQTTIDNAGLAARELRAACSGLVPSVWVERYVDERVEPLREEFALLQARVRQINPDGFSAAFPEN